MAKCAREEVQRRGSAFQSGERLETVCGPKVHPSDDDDGHTDAQQDAPEHPPVVVGERCRAHRIRRVVPNDDRLSVEVVQRQHGRTRLSVHRVRNARPCGDEAARLRNGFPGHCERVLRAGGVGIATSNAVCPDGARGFIFSVAGRGVLPEKNTDHRIADRV